MQHYSPQIQFWSNMVRSVDFLVRRIYRRNIRKRVAYGSTYQCVSGMWQFMPRIFDVTSERSTSPAPSPLSLVAQFVCFTGGVLCWGKKPTGHYIPDASLLRISFFLSCSLLLLSLSFSTSYKISYNLCTPWARS